MNMRAQILSFDCNCLLREIDLHRSKIKQFLFHIEKTFFFCFFDRQTFEDYRKRQRQNDQS